MSDTKVIELTAATRELKGSRNVRRLRRSGAVPGVLYGGDGAPVAIEADGRQLRQVIAQGSTFFNLALDGGQSVPVMLKEDRKDPVKGNTVHFDLLRVSLDKPVHAVVALELTGADSAPGIREGGILEQTVRELNVEGLPNEIPTSLSHDISEIEIGTTVSLADIALPADIKLLDDLETVVATVVPPRLTTAAEEESESAGGSEGGGEGAAEAAAEGGE